MSHQMRQDEVAKDVDGAPSPSNLKGLGEYFKLLVGWSRQIRRGNGRKWGVSPHSLIWFN